MKKSALFILFIVFAGVLSFQKEVLSLSVSQQVSKPLTPVILIPGTSRTKLVYKKNGKIAWGNFRDFFSLQKRETLALPIDSTNLRENRGDLVLGGLMEEITVIPFIFKVYTHKKFLERMQKIAGYQLGEMERPKPGDNFFVFVYDWRRSNEENAERLAQSIERLKTFYGNPETKFDIVAHCSAMYMVRYYALYGSEDVLDEKNPQPTNIGARNIRKLILISPPYRGTILAFQLMCKGFRPLKPILPFLRSYTPYEFFTFPSFFEMLPPSGEKIFLDEHGNTLDLDLYDASNWVRYGWSVFSSKEQRRLKRKLKHRFRASWKEKFQEENERRLLYLDAVLKRTKAFHQAINEETKTISPEVQTYIVILRGGLTLAKVEFSKKKKSLRFKGGSIEHLRFAPGDQMVTQESMHGHYKEQIPQEVFLNGKHRQMANSRVMHFKVMELLFE